MTIQDRLYEKVSAEYAARIEELKQMPPARVIENAYEITAKADLLLCFETGEFSGKEARALLTLAKPLDHIYQQWSNVDLSDYMDRLQNCINTETAHLHRNSRKRNLTKAKGAR